MTGIAGFSLQKGTERESILLESMLDGLAGKDRENGYAIQQEVIAGRGGVGHVGRVVNGEQVCFSSAKQDNALLLIQGNLYGSTARELLEGYQRNGDAFLDSLPVDGAFSGVLYDRAEKRIVLFSDPFGLEPVYLCWNNELFAFSTSIKAMLDLPGVEKTVDPVTLASFWNFGYALLDHTPFQQIRLLPPGTVCSVNLADWNRKSRSYLQLVDFFTESGNSKADLETVARDFQDAVRKRSNDMDSLRLGLSLSGGLDSRAILGGLGDRGAGLTTYTLGLPGCADERLAARMAAICHCRHSFVPINESALADFKGLARMMVTLSDGLYHPHESTERVALDYLNSNPFDVMLRGHGGEIAKAALAYPVQATREMEHMPVSGVIDSLLHKASLAGHGIDMQSLLTDSMYDNVHGMAKKIFHRAAEPAVQAGLGNIDLCIYLYIDQCIRRQVVASLSLFRSRVGVRLPYLDRTFLKGLLALPVQQRWSGEFHKFFIHEYAPGLESIPDSNTGAPLNAGPLRLLVTDKVNAVLKRLGVTGFRHYTEFQKWQRKYFNDAIQDILFSEQSLARGYYRPEGLREIYDAHVSGQRSCGHFLGTAVAVELWHREFVD